MSGDDVADEVMQGLPDGWRLVSTQESGSAGVCIDGCQVEVKLVVKIPRTGPTQLRSELRTWLGGRGWDYADVNKIREREQRQQQADDPSGFSAPTADEMRLEAETDASMYPLGCFFTRDFGGPNDRDNERYGSTMLTPSQSAPDRLELGVTKNAGT